MVRKEKPGELADDVVSNRLSRRDVLRRAFVLGLSMPVISGLLAACGGDDDTAPTAAGTTPAAPATGQTPAPSTQQPASPASAGTPEAVTERTAVTGQGKPGGSLTITFSPTTNDIDVQSHNTGTVNEVAHYHYETLFDRVEDGVQNLLVQDAEASEDGLNHTWRLQQGVTFHDGSDFNAEVVKWNFERKVNNKLPLWDLIPWDTIEVVDEHTIDVTLTRPYPGIFGVLAAKTYSMYSPTFVERVGDDGVKNQASGTGPFKVDEYIPNEIVRMSRYENYWQEGLPYLDEVIFRVVPDRNTRATMVESGEAGMSLGVSIQDIERFLTTDGIQVMQGIGSQQAYITMNNRKPPLDDVAVRQAINYAIDKEGMIQAVYLDKYARVAKAVYVNPTIDGFVEAGSYDYDPDRARQMLDEAGWVEGSDGIREKDGERFTINIHTRSGADSADVELVELTQAMLQEVGIDLEIVVLDSAAFLAAVTVEPEASQYNLVNLTWGTFTGDADYIMQTIYACDSAAPRYYNRAYFCDEQVDEMIVESEQAPTLAARNEIYADIIRRVHELAPIIQLFDLIQNVPMRDNLKGVYLEPAGINWPAKYAWFEE